MGKEASVLTACLQLSLTVLDGSLQLDGGKSLSLNHTAILTGIGQWASAVFTRLDAGGRVRGGGGRYETELQRAAAGVLVKLEAITSKWQRSMIDV
jgi:telomere length regulation protein